MSKLLRLDQVALHPVMESVFTELADALPERLASGLLSAQAIHQVCRSFPMTVVKVPGSHSSSKGKAALSGPRYHCVAGLRSFQIAKVRLPGEARVPAIIESCAPPNLETRARQELFLGLVLFGMHGSRNAAALETLRSSLPREEVLAIFPAFASARRMADALGISRNALRAQNPKPRAKGEED